MEKLKVILVDDEEASLITLRYEIETYCTDLEVLDALQDPVLALDSIQKNAPDLVFLDIEMPKLSGFELLESLPEVNFDVIFVTAYDEHAVRAFEFNAVDYLLKPVLKSKLIQSVRRVRERKSHAFPKSELDALMQNMQKSTVYEQHIAIPTSEGFEFIQREDITYLGAEGNYTWIHQAEQQKILVSKSLKEVAGLLTNSYFFRAHKSYLVNMRFVQKYVRGRGGYLIMKDSTQIPVSRMQRRELMQRLSG